MLFRKKITCFFSVLWEKGQEGFRVEGGRHDNNLQRISPLPRHLQPLQQSKQNIRPQRPLMSLIQNDRRIPAQAPIRQHLPQQHAVRQELDACLCA